MAVEVLFLRIYLIMFALTNNYMVYTSTDFDGQRSADYTLLIRVEHTENVFAITDDGGQLKFFTTVDPRQAADTGLTGLLNLNFGRVKIVAPSQYYSFVPAAVFDESYLTVYRRYLPDDGLTDSLTSIISPLDLQLVYQINRLGLNPIIEKFPDAAIYPTVQSFLCGVGTFGTQNEEPLLALDKIGPVVRVSFFDAGKFRYCNDFEVSEVADFNYYLLSVLTHFGLEGRGIRFLLSGDVAFGDPYYQCVEKYSDTLAFADTAQLTGISVPPVLQKEQHRYLSLFGLRLCE